MGRRRRMNHVRAGICAAALLTCCSGSSPAESDTAGGVADAMADPATEADLADREVDATDLELDPQGDAARSIAPFTVVTFNTGSGPELRHDAEPDDGYSSDHADISDQYYGNGLAWEPFIDDTRAFFEQTEADVVVFQEIFWPGDCPAVPEDARAGFVCEDWIEGDPTVAERVLDDGWQIMCHPGKPDKCAAVRRGFGSFQGCDTAFCLEGLTGFRVDGCGSGARIARGVIELVGGGELTLVHVHSSSGFENDTLECRIRQIDQVFVDLGDGEPGANGEINLMMGDLNTDPVRGAAFDISAAHWNVFVGEDRAFHFISDVSADAPASYAGSFNIDHVISDRLAGSCWIAGLTEGHPAVTDAVFFDHKPVVCEVAQPSESSNE